MVYVAVLFIFIVTGWLFARAAQRSFFYPRPPHAMPDPVDETLDELLQRVETTLRTHAPGVADVLRPGLSDAEITRLESEGGIQLADDLRALYRWHNGAGGDPAEPLIPGHHFLPLEEAIRRRNEFRGQLRESPPLQRVAHSLFAGHRTGWLTVLDDLCGDGYFYDPARRCSPGSFFYHFAEFRHYRYFPSLSHFLAGVIECYETGVYRQRRSGKLDEDHERSQEIFQQFAVSHGR